MNENNEAERHEMKHYMMIALTVFVTFCCCILFFFMIYRFDELAALWRQIANILQPITIGLVLAYLLNPVMKFQEKYLYRFCLASALFCNKDSKHKNNLQVLLLFIFRCCHL